MKYLLLVLVTFAVSLSALASDTIPKAPRYKLEGNTVTDVSSKAVSNHDSTTTYKYTDKAGKTYPVFVGKKGGYYAWVTSKDNKLYKKYIKF